MAALALRLVQGGGGEPAGGGSAAAPSPVRWTSPQSHSPDGRGDTLNSLFKVSPAGGSVLLQGPSPTGAGAAPPSQASTDTGQGQLDELASARASASASLGFSSSAAALQRLADHLSSSNLRSARIPSNKPAYSIDDRFPELLIRRLRGRTTAGRLQDGAFVVDRAATKRLRDSASSPGPRSAR